MSAFPGSVLLTQGDIFSQTSDKRHPLGTRGYTRDGRVFRYTKNGAVALTVGKLVQAGVGNTNWQKNLHPSTNFGSSVTTDSTYIYVTLRAVSSAAISSYANELADGYLIVNDGTGQGQMVQIQSNTTANSTALGTAKIKVVFREGEKLTQRLVATTAAATDSQVGLIENLYNDVVVSAKHATGTGVALGVTPRAITANYYFWLQTWGPAVCLCDTAGAIGYAAIRSATDAGGVRQNTTADVGITQPKVGDFINTGADTEYSAINIMLAP